MISMQKYILTHTLTHTWVEKYIAQFLQYKHEQIFYDHQDLPFLEI